MDVTTISLLVDKKRDELENALKNSDYVDEFEIEDLDKQDVRKDVFIAFSSPVSLKYVNDLLKDIIGDTLNNRNIE